MATLTTIRLPIQWDQFGLPTALQTRTTCLITGDPAWGWDGNAPDLGIPLVDQASGESHDGWDLDHVVLMVPDLDHTVGVLKPLSAPRLRTSVDGRRTAFYRFGPLLEVIESPVRAPALFGVALVTDRSLQATALEWRSLGITVTDVQPAMQPGRHIFTVRGLDAGLAVISPDGAKA